MTPEMLPGDRPDTATARVMHTLHLLQTRAAWTSDVLAAELGITQRTVRRIINSLRALGYDIDASSGVGGGYRLGVYAA